MNIDVRPSHPFEQGHAPKAAHIPLEELAARSHELPWDRAEPLHVFDDDTGRVQAACAALVKRGFAGAGPADPVRDRSDWVQGPATRRLWSGSPFLEAAIAGYAAPTPAERPTETRPAALEVACGAGRDAVILAEAGFRVTAIDKLESALGRVRDLARRNGVADRVATRAIDLEADEVDLGCAVYDWISVSRFLWRPLFPVLARALRSGGRLCYQTFDVQERARSGRPRSPKHLLEAGELVERVTAAGLVVIKEEAKIERTGRFMQAVLAEKPTSADKGPPPLPTTPPQPTPPPQPATPPLPTTAGQPTTPSQRP